jgi:type IV secretory pathway VirB10-like protein
MSEQRSRSKGLRLQALGGAILLMAGVAVTGGAALSLLRTEHAQLAQAAPDDKSKSNLDKSDPNKSDEVRPTTPAPQPARPDATTGAAPPAPTARPPEKGEPLPPAPAEKSAAPIPDRK